MMSCPIYDQGDPKWGSSPIAGGVTLASHGCFITSLAMALGNFAVDASPQQALDALKAAGGIMPDGQMTYDGVMRAWPQVTFRERVYTTCDVVHTNTSRMEINVALSRIRKHLKLGQPVILAVDCVGRDGIADHAVLAVDSLTDDFIIHDPWQGKRLKFTERYGPIGRGVYGYVSLIGPPIGFPEPDGMPSEGQAAWKMTQALKLMGLTHKARMYVKESIDHLLN